MDNTPIENEKEIMNPIEPEREIKNLANCTNVEFLVQTNKIRKKVQDWLTIINFKAIRARLPELLEVKPDMSPEEKKRVELENEVRLERQWKQNISDMLDAALETNAEKTAELLGLISFVDPEEIRDNKVKMPFLINSFFNMLEDKDVMGFFSSLIKSELISTFTAARR